MPGHNYFKMDIDEALSHVASNLVRTEREINEWNMDRDDYSLLVQDWLLELTEAMQFLGALVTAHRKEHEEKR